METISAKAATCKEEGRTEGSKCSRCGEVFVESQAIPKTDHVRQTVSGYDPTCTATGLTSGVKCSTCGTVLEAQQKIAALGHNPSTTYVTIGGDNNYPVCLRCGANLCPHAIDGESAIWEDGDSWDASCVEGGHVAGTSCAICGTVFSQGYDIPATGQHKLSNEYAVVERANCTSKGKTVYLCEICEGEIEVETPIDSSEHSFTIQIMDEEGNITDVRCDRCGASMGAAIETPSVD